MVASAGTWLPRPDTTRDTSAPDARAGRSARTPPRPSGREQDLLADLRDRDLAVVDRPPALGILDRLVRTPGRRQRSHPELAERPPGMRVQLQQVQQLVVPARRQHRAQAVCRAGEVPPPFGVGTPRQFHQVHEPVRPGACNLRHGAQLAPVLAERLDVGDLVLLAGVPKPIQPCLAGGGVGGSGGDDRDEVLYCPVHRAADRPRRAVHVLERG